MVVPLHSISLCFIGNLLSCNFHTIFCSHKFHKIKNYFIFEMLKKIILVNFQRIIELFTQNIVNNLSKNGFGIGDPEKTFSGSRIQGSKRHRMPDPDPQHWLQMKDQVFYTLHVNTTFSPS
jgi:hypothetical protein